MSWLLLLVVPTCHELFSSSFAKAEEKYDISSEVPTHLADSPIQAFCNQKIKVRCGLAWPCKQTADPSCLAGSLSFLFLRFRARQTAANVSTRFARNTELPTHYS